MGQDSKKEPLRLSERINQSPVPLILGILMMSLAIPGLTDGLQELAGIDYWEKVLREDPDPGFSDLFGFAGVEQDKVGLSLAKYIAFFSMGVAFVQLAAGWLAVNYAAIAPMWGRIYAAMGLGVVIAQVVCFVYLREGASESVLVLFTIGIEWPWMIVKVAINAAWPIAVFVLMGRASVVDACDPGSGGDVDA